MATKPIHILFEKSHPKDLVEALKLIHQTDASNNYSISFFDNTIDQSSLRQPILFLFDYKRNGLDITTEGLYKSGYRIFILKTKKKEKLDFFELSLTIMRFWPKIVNIIREEESPFVYSYKYRGSKLARVRE